MRVGSFQGRPIIKFPPEWSQADVMAFCASFTTAEEWQLFREDYYLGVLVCPFGKAAPWGRTKYRIAKLHPDDSDDPGDENLNH